MKKIVNIFLMTILGVAGQAQYSSDLKVEELMDSGMNGFGQKISYPNFGKAQVTIRKITFPPGATTGWHKHGIPVFSYILRGTLSVEFEKHETVTYSSGESFAESTEVYHRGNNDSNEDLEVLVIYLGGDDQPLSEAKPVK